MADVSHIVPRSIRRAAAAPRAAAAGRAPSRLAFSLVLFAALSVAAPLAAQPVGAGLLPGGAPTAESPESQTTADTLSASTDLRAWLEPQRLGSSLQTLLLVTVVSVAPAILLMTTCYVRIAVVLALLKQALGTPQLPPAQVLTALSMFLTLLIMAPVWQQVYDEALLPYSQEQITLDEAWEAGVDPVRRFMADQIRRTGNDADVVLFLDYVPELDLSEGSPELVYYGAGAGQQDVPLRALMPAFMLSELKTAFLIGFQIYLPFVILDIVVASVTISMGMLMLPPALISLPFKLLLFVMVDGWHLVVEALLRSFV